MGSIFSFLSKAAASSAISGYAAHQLLSQTILPRPARLSLTGIASLSGLAYFMKVWIQDYYFDWSYNDNRDLTGRTAVVTGGTVNGLGHAIASILYQLGAKVIITVRTKEKGEAALEKLKATDGRASYVLCDFLSEPSIRNCIAEIKTKTSGGIDFLVLNAGISGQQTAKGDLAGENENLAKVWMTNHVGPFIFAQELMPSLVEAAKRDPSEHPRVVWVSSGAHKRSVIDWENPFHPNRKFGGLAFSAYGQSKLANIMHAKEYQKKVRELIRKETKESRVSESLDVKCFSITPGAVWTNILPKIPLLNPFFWIIMRSPAKGAQVIKMACLDKTLKGGEYLSNCYVKESEGMDGCSNDEALWERLWELTIKQVEEKEHEKYITLPNIKKTN